MSDSLATSSPCTVAHSADRTITLVLDPTDDVDDLARLRRLHARPLGRIVCEPAPAGGTAGLARSLLEALGKKLELTTPRAPLWNLVDIHLYGERVRDLYVLRAHTLPYGALRQLADHIGAADVHLWLVVHRERPTAPIAQLLEGLPHDTAPLHALLDHRPHLDNIDADDTIPPGAGLDFPYLAPIGDHFEPAPRRRPRAAIARRLTRADRATVHDTWDKAHQWATGWLNDHDGATYPDAADALYLLARRGDSASEIYVRIRAALETFDHAGLDSEPAVVDDVLAHSFGEVRPFQFNAAVARATALADQTPDPQLAALIALAAVRREPFCIRQANLANLASDGSVLLGRWGGTLAIPPELRRFLATWHHQRTPTATQRPSPLFLGNSHGRLSQPTIRRRLAALDAPTSLWEDPPDTMPGEGYNADGRLLLHNLTAWNLWLQRRHQHQHSNLAAPV